MSKLTNAHKNTDVRIIRDRVEFFMIRRAVSQKIDRKTHSAGCLRSDCKTFTSCSRTLECCLEFTKEKIQMAHRNNTLDFTKPERVSSAQNIKRVMRRYALLSVRVEASCVEVKCNRVWAVFLFSIFAWFSLIKACEIVKMFAMS